MSARVPGRLAAAFLTLLAVPAVAAPTEAVLSGTLRTSDGLPLPHTALVLVGPGGAHRFVTGPEGRFEASGLPAGRYAVTVDVPGFVLVAEGGAPSVLAQVEPPLTRLELTLRPLPLREHVVVTAARGEAAPGLLGVATSVLDEARLTERQASSLAQALRDVPGLAVARTGGLGQQASAFMRGGDSRYVRVLVDGVPVNQPGGALDLAGALPLDLSRVEVVRGAASSLYGTDALAGVVHLVSRRGTGETAVRALAEAGGLGWRQGLLGAGGGGQAFDWNVGGRRLDTDNEEPNSRFAETSAAASLGARFGADTAARAVLRAASSVAGTPGPTAIARPDHDALIEKDETVLGLEIRHTRSAFSQAVRLGFSRAALLSRNPEDSGPYEPAYGGRRAGYTVSDLTDPRGYLNDTRRVVAGYQADWQPHVRHLLTAGVEVERETGEIGSRTAGDLLSPARTNAGLYLQDRWRLSERAHAILGGRVEHNGSFGIRAVPRAAVAVRLGGGPDATVLRASAGEGVKEPTFLESFGVSFFSRGNPGLRPERSSTFDIGLTERAWGGRLRAEVTLFHHVYRDQIGYTVTDFVSFAGTFVNVGRTRARGLEVALEGAPAPALLLTASYTWLDGRVLAGASDFDPVYAVGQPLLRRPEHSASFGASWTRGGFGAGATLVLAGARADSDFFGLGFTRNPGHARLDARARARLGRGLEAFAVGENLLDRRYEEVLGYPALGRALRLGVRFPSARP
jgi:vitamin B12 transporter